ncbi:MAG: hypothetical protein JXA46_12735 [Dehalococcoidales bacterium]|nr:hypothetical protein [Dehalococcoidales bacterium]
MKLASTKKSNNAEVTEIRLSIFLRRADEDIVRAARKAPGVSGLDNYCTINS